MHNRSNKLNSQSLSDALQKIDSESSKSIADKDVPPTPCGSPKKIFHMVLFKQAHAAMEKVSNDSLSSKTYSLNKHD